MKVPANDGDDDGGDGGGGSDGEDGGHEHSFALRLWIMLISSHRLPPFHLFALHLHFHSLLISLY